VPGTAPLFSSVFNYRHSHAAGEEPSGLDGVRRCRCGSGPTTPRRLDRGQRQRLRADGDAVDPVHPDRVAALLHTCLDKSHRRAEESPARSLATNEVLDEDERRQVVTEWNDTAAAAPRSLVPELIAAQGRGHAGGDRRHLRRRRPDGSPIERGDPRTR